MIQHKTRHCGTVVSALLLRLHTSLPMPTSGASGSSVQVHHAINCFLPDTDKINPQLQENGVEDQTTETTISVPERTYVDKLMRALACKRNRINQANLGSLVEIILEIEYQ
jgi:hypothetical protein